MNRLIIGAFILTTFGALNTQPAFEEKAAKEKTEEMGAPLVKKDVHVPNPQLPDDRKLTQIGQKFSDAKGESALKAYKKVDEAIKVGPIEVTVKEMKVLHVTPDYSMIDFFHGYTHEEDFDIVKVKVEIKNKSDEKIKFSPIAFLETNTGEHLPWEDDIYLEELNGELDGNGTKNGDIGFIVRNGDVRGISLMTSDAVTGDGKILAKGKSVELAF
ncbi:DUF4352 domain-containing protein [Peribacillus sp. SI8-4]|uniref:DUF4352 domain-containing protein n=1 Tax=Peribacillus sp. SI8-4 TaxID=3048009 RepID=UPI002552DC78|nr:DUF4352 domain-containing protein [Peribacillus sp. SI8-4]